MAAQRTRNPAAGEWQTAQPQRTQRTQRAQRPRCGRGTVRDWEGQSRIRTWVAEARGSVEAFACGRSVATSVRELRWRAAPSYPLYYYDSISSRAAQMMRRGDGNLSARNWLPGESGPWCRTRPPLAGLAPARPHTPGWLLGFASPPRPGLRTTVPTGTRVGPAKTPACHAAMNALPAEQRPTLRRSGRWLLVARVAGEARAVCFVVRPFRFPSAPRARRIA